MSLSNVLVVDLCQAMAEGPSEGVKVPAGAQDKLLWEHSVNSTFTQLVFENVDLSQLDTTGTYWNQV